MGVVYEAHDRRRGGTVALKTLKNIDGPGLYRFKHEFRALAGIHHPNLVTLYELMVVDDTWLFTMELIDGCDILTHVRSDGRREAPGPDVPEPRRYVAPGDDTLTLDTEELDGPTAGPIPRYGDQVDVERLRAALRQLAEGVDALHEVGRLHRDIKPSNILVEQGSARVVICDFGLVAELEQDQYVTRSDQIVGTVPYMSPEQAARTPLTEASDWYSVGVLLHQALVGQVPFAMHRHQILQLKQTVDAVPPADQLPAGAEDLADLCAALLRRDPGSRPPGHEVLRRLGARRSRRATVSPASRSGRGFVGRRAELAELNRAIAEVDAGRPVVVNVSGPSGMGKTALVRHFLEQVQRRDDSVVFRGRCYHNEVLAYKAFDGVVDELSSYLAALSPQQAAVVVPDDCVDLARLFPVLRRVPAIAEPERTRIGAVDPHESRRRGFRTLRQLLGNIARQQRLVLFIDDLQWGDVDSAALLQAIALSPAAPPMLLMVTYRSEELAQSALLRELREATVDTGIETSIREVAVEALSRQDAEALTRQCLGSARPDELVSTIVRESGGNPLLIDELVRHLESAADDTRELGATRATVDDMLRFRIARLPEDQRKLLSVIAVAGKPTSVEIVESAAAVTGDITSLLGLLLAQHLIRRRNLRTGSAVECYHDRVRETVTAQLSDAEARDHHRQVALALVRAGPADPESLVAHWLGAGERQRAAAAALPAARQAEQALAFDRAAEMYQLALDNVDSAEAETELRTRLGDSLANGGRGLEAAHAYLAAAGLASAARALELRRQAALEFLRSGHVDDGVSILTEVLSEVGFRLARGPGRAALSLAAKRAHLRLRGLHYRRRDESQVAAEQLARVDVCWTAAVGLGMVDMIRGAEFQTRHLLLALRAGEPHRVARALVLEVAFNAVSKRGRRRARRITEWMRPLVSELDSPYVRTVHHGAQAFVHYQAGNFEQALRIAGEARELASKECTGIAWENHSAVLYQLWSLHYLGEVGEMAAQVRALRREAVSRGDLYAGNTLRTGFPGIVTMLEEDSPNHLDTLVRHAMKRWSKADFHLQHYWAELAQAHRELYIGDGEAAHRRTTALFRQTRRALLLGITMVRFDLVHLRARTALAAACCTDRREPLLRQAERDARDIEHNAPPTLVPVATMVRGLVALAAGDLERGVAGLEEAEERLAEGRIRLLENVCRMRRGQLLGGDRGRELVAAAVEFMTEQRIADPERAADMYAPMPRSTS